MQTASPKTGMPAGLHFEASVQSPLTALAQLRVHAIDELPIGANETRRRLRRHLERRGPPPNANPRAGARRLSPPNAGGAGLEIGDDHANTSGATTITVTPGRVPKWTNGSDCKSDGLCLRRFESFRAHERNCPAGDGGAFVCASDS